MNCPCTKVSLPKDRPSHRRGVLGSVIRSPVDRANGERRLRLLDIAKYPGGIEAVLTGRVAFNNRQTTVSKSLQTVR
jgi:hypothetical protein